ncbi:VOC family protein [Nocardia sp. NPDC004068]|uniref:VOC family protein n=1 Tax=Nocardia sp. NPDC004068 TaxID=3364303 RepID=UPI0036D0B268
MSHAFAVGAPCWFDVTAPDIEAAAAFYGELFGWSARLADPAQGNYAVLTQDGARVAGIACATAPDGGVKPSAWLPYFSVADLGPTVAAATADGATVLAERVEIPGELEFAILADPAGAAYGLSRLDAHPGTERFGAPGNPVWVQYTATGAPADAMAHYARVLGWIHRDAAWETSVDKPYQALTTSAGGREFGGAAAARPGEPAPAWAVTFHVTDCDATAARAVDLGGTIVQAPHDNPGPSRLAVLADPNGASFALMAFGG